MNEILNMNYHRFQHVIKISNENSQRISGKMTIRKGVPKTNKDMIERLKNQLK